MDISKRFRPTVVIRHTISKSSLGIAERGNDTFLVREQLGGLWSADSLLPAYLQDMVSWEEVLSCVKTWTVGIKNVLEEQERYRKTPDLWDGLHESKEFLGGQHEQAFENSPFTDAEQAQISEQIQQIKAYIENTYELASEQMSHVEARLDEAEQASRRMGRKDWLLLFNGAVFSLILSDLIPPQAAQHVLLMALHGLGHLFGMGGPPPHLPPAG